MALIHMAHEHSVFDAHHHSHHVHQVEYKRPQELTTNLGLFALKKLNAMNPDILTEREKKLLRPVSPGTISCLGQGFFLVSATFYSAYIWRILGLGGIARAPLSVIPVGGLIGAGMAFNFVANYMREWTWALPRSSLVKNYSDKYGPGFLLDVLDPKFRLPEGGLQ